jgi:hypothetical protein
VSIDLVAEVLDHYHGTHARKLWLIAWAEKVSNDDGSRTGYCKRTIIAARLGVSESRASGLARELEAEGTIKRLGGGVWGKTATFELLPLDAAQGQPRAHPTQGQPRADPTGAPEPHAQGQPRPRAQGQPRPRAQGQPRADPNPHNPDNPQEPSALARAASDPRAILAGLGGLDLKDDEISFVITELGPRDDLAGYLLRQIGKDGGGGLAAWIRRKLGRPEPDHRPWCEDPRCDHGWIDTDDGKVMHCPNRHRGQP